MKNQINMFTKEQLEIANLVSNPFYEVEDPREIIVLHKAFLEDSDKIFIFKNIRGGVSVWTSSQVNSRDKNNDNG